MGSLLYGPPQLNSFNSGKRIEPAAAAESLCVGAPAAFFNNGKRAAPAAAAESLCVGAPAMFLTMGNPIYGPLRLNFFNNGKPLSQPPRLNLCVSVRRPRFLTMGSLLCPGLQPSQIFSCPFV